MCSTQVRAANERKAVTLRPTSSNTTFNKRPHGPEKPIVELWLDDEVLTVEFIEPHGEAILTLSGTIF